MASIRPAASRSRNRAKSIGAGSARRAASAGASAAITCGRAARSARMPSSSGQSSRAISTLSVSASALRMSTSATRAGICEHAAIARRTVSSPTVARATSSVSGRRDPVPSASAATCGSASAASRERQSSGVSGDRRQAGRRSSGGARSACPKATGGTARHRCASRPRRGHGGQRRARSPPAARQPCACGRVRATDPPRLPYACARSGARPLRRRGAWCRSGGNARGPCAGPGFSGGLDTGSDLLRYAVARVRRPPARACEPLKTGGKALATY